MFLEIHELRKSFGAGENRTEVLKGLDFSVEKGEICVLLGPSGSGKSTLLNIIGGIDEADGGYISIDGEKMEEMKEKALTEYRRRLSLWTNAPGSSATSSRWRRRKTPAPSLSR